MKNKNLSPKTVRLLKLTREAILANADAYSQGNSGNGYKPRCQSPACVIGWMLHFATRYWPKAKRAEICDQYRCHSSNGRQRVCEPVIGLNYTQFMLLYWSDKWPGQFLPSNHRNAAKRITYFIKTDGNK